MYSRIFLEMNFSHPRDQTHTFLFGTTITDHFHSLLHFSILYSDLLLMSQKPNVIIFGLSVRATPPAPSHLVPRWPEHPQPRPRHPSGSAPGRTSRQRKCIEIDHARTHPLTWPIASANRRQVLYLSPHYVSPRPRARLQRRLFDLSRKLSRRRV